MIIKLGGSLTYSNAIKDCLAIIEQTKLINIVIVPGGGEFANQVRYAQQVWQFNESIAHEMAILAMQQMALLFHGLYPNFQLIKSIRDFSNLMANSVPVIWSPILSELNQANIPATWEMTSDSLAIWLAIQLHVEQLIVVKSIFMNSQNYQQLAEQGIVDSLFPQFVQQSSIKPKLIHYSQLKALLIDN
jgi:aspartokinase-like uncharacterized kinase